MPRPMRLKHRGEARIKQRLKGACGVSKELGERTWMVHATRRSEVHQGQFPPGMGLAKSRQRCVETADGASMIVRCVSAFVVHQVSKRRFLGRFVRCRHEVVKLQRQIEQLCIESACRQSGCQKKGAGRRFGRRCDRGGEYEKIHGGGLYGFATCPAGKNAQQKCSLKIALEKW